jgi:hypothetical protein
VLFETGDKDYYWLNNVVAVGKLSSVEDKSARKEGDSFLLRIDVWHVSVCFSISFLFCWCEDWMRGSVLLTKFCVF